MFQDYVLSGRTSRAKTMENEEPVPFPEHLYVTDITVNNSSPGYVAESDLENSVNGDILAIYKLERVVKVTLKTTKELVDYPISQRKENK